MKVWSVATQKGGVGKTTTVVSLGGLLAQQGYKTLLLDMDPHGSLTSYFGLDPDTTEDSLYELFRIRDVRSDLALKSIVYPTPFENLFLLPASSAMATLDRQLGSVGGMGLVISKALKMLSDEYDFALIDCPPVLGVLMINALAACDYLVIPVQTEFLAMKGLERMLRTLKMIGQAKHPVPDYTILPTMFDRRTGASISTLKLLQEKYADDLSRFVIPVDTQFRDASRLGIPLTIKAPKDRGSVAYSQFLTHLLEVEQHKENTASSVF